MAAKRLLDATDVPFFIASFFRGQATPLRRVACLQTDALVFKKHILFVGIFSPLFFCLSAMPDAAAAMGVKGKAVLS